MSALRAVRRTTAAVALLATAGAALWAGIAAVTESRVVFRVARAHRNDTLVAGLERALGAEYLESLVAVRAAVPKDGVVHFIDAEDAPSGSTYLALHYLAPRRLELVGIRRLASPRRLRRDLPGDVEHVLIVGELHRPLRYVPVDDLRSALDDAR